MRRSTRPGEQIRHHHIEGSGRELFKDGAGVADPNAHPARPARPAAALAEGQPPPDKLGQRGVRLDRQLADPGRVAATYRARVRPPPPRCSTRSGSPGRCRQVDQVPEPPHVIELQVLRIIEVNV